MDYETKKYFLLNVAFIAVIAFLCYFVGKFMLNFLLPFLISLGICFLVNKTSTLLNKKTHIKEKTLRTIILVGFYLLFSLLIVLIIWIIFKYSSRSFDGIKNYIEDNNNIFYKLTDGIIDLAKRLPNKISEKIIIALDDFSARILSLSADLVSSAAIWLVEFLPRFIISSAVTVVSSFYISRDYKRLVRFLKNMLGDRRFLVLIEIKEILTGSVLRFFSGYLVLSLITFIELYIGFLVLSVKHPLIFAFLVALVDLLPVLGSGTVLIPYAVYLFIMGDILSAVGFILIYIIGLVVRNFLEPKIIGARLDINPLLMLITVFVGLRIGGLLGMILLPIAIVVVITYYKRQLNRENGALA